MATLKDIRNNVSFIKSLLSETRISTGQLWTKYLQEKHKSFSEPIKNMSTFRRCYLNRLKKEEDVEHEVKQISNKGRTTMWRLI